MKYDLNIIKQLLIKYNNNKTSVAKELGIDRSNLNRYLRKMQSEGMLDENYNVSINEIMVKECYDKCVNTVGENRVLVDENTVTFYIIEDDDGSLTIDELEKLYDGFND